MSKWYQGKVIKGKNIASSLGFPTLNIDNVKQLANQKQGVYLCRVKIRDNEYYGLLYYGPRLVLGEKEPIVEIYVLAFKQNVYGENVLYQLLSYLRKEKKLPDLKSFQKQLQKDLAKARKLIT